MKSTSLRELIFDRVKTDLNDIAICHKSNNLLYSDLINLPQKFHNKKVILFIEDTIALITAMVIFDGSVSELCPISTSTKEEDLEHLLSLRNFDIVVSDAEKSKINLFTHKKIDYVDFAKLVLSNDENINHTTQKTTWLVPTSGTTSKPKLVEHHINSLVSTAIKKKKIRLSKTEVWGQFYDMTRYAGYQVLFNSLLNGHTLVTSPYTEEINARVEYYSKKSVSHISATPTQWRKILMSGLANKIPLKQIILGGEAADQQILSALRNYFPNSKITHTFASTEAGLGISVSDGLSGFPLHFLEHSEGSVDIKIHDGKLLLRSSSTALGYTDKTRLRDEEGWIDTGDLVRIEGDRFFIIGRETGIINIGGDKVNPESVRQTLLQHDMVAEAHVYGRKNPITGMLLATDIQLKSNIDNSEGKKAVKLFIREKLQLKDQPRIINIVDTITTNLTGKISQRI